MSLLPGLIAAAWWGICIARWGEPLRWAKTAVNLWAKVPWGGILTRGLAPALGRHAIVLALGVLATLAFAGVGGALVRIVRVRGAATWERHALGILFGFGLLGAGVFGIALCGLAFAPVLWAAAAAGLALPGARGAAGAAVRGIRWRPSARPGLGWIVLALAPVVPVALAMLVPDMHIDVLTYHLAIPDQVLRVHKFTATGASVAHGFPLTAEFVYAGTIPLGRDELSHWFQAAPFLAAVALLAGWAGRRAGPAAGWMTAAAVLTCGAVGQQVSVSKNDMAAAGFAVAGAVGLARVLEGNAGWLAASGLLFGFGCGVKFNGQILAAVALACMLPFGRLRRGLGAWLALAALPALPWLLRSWVMFGDPVWPALSAWWPGAWWRPEDQASVGIARGQAGALSSLQALAAEVTGFLAGDMPPVMLAVPFLLFGQRALGGPGRWLLGFSVVSTVTCAVMMRSQWSRLAAPALFLLAALAAVAAVEAARGWGPWRRRAGLAAGAVACWIPLGYFLGAWVWPVPTFPYLAGAISREQWRAQRLTLLDQARQTLEGLPGRGKRMISIGDSRLYGMPARFFTARNYGCTWAWDFSRDAPSARRVRIRFRQLDIRWVLHNFLTEGFPHPIVEPYTWDDRMVEVWREFVDRNLELVVPPAQVDNLNGGFCFWRLRDKPLAVRPAFLPYLPGVETLYYQITSCRSVDQMLLNALEVNRRLPNVDFVMNRVAEAYYLKQDWRLTWKYTLPSLLHGTVDDANLWQGAIAAANLGYLDEAERLVLKAVEVRPDGRASADQILAAIKAARDRAKPQPRDSTGLFPSGR